MLTLNTITILLDKFSDLDQELIVLNPIRLQSDISDLESGSDRIKGQIKEIKIVEPKEFYHEDQHDEVKGEIRRVAGELILAQKQVSDIQELIKKYGRFSSNHSIIELIAHLLIVFLGPLKMLP